MSTVINQQHSQLKSGAVIAFTRCDALVACNLAIGSEKLLRALHREHPGIIAHLSRPERFQGRMVK